MCRRKKWKLGKSGYKHVTGCILQKHFSLLLVYLIAFNLFYQVLLSLMQIKIYSSLICYSLGQQIHISYFMCKVMLLVLQEGKESCKTNNNPEDLLECLDGEVCNTFVENLWPPNGPQQFAVSRGCGARVDDCLVFTDPNERHVQRQACSISCEGDNCNTFDKVGFKLNSNKFRKF